MKEQQISFKTYKLAKEKGFSNIQSFYKNITKNYVDSGGNETDERYNTVEWVTEEVIPTQSLLQKWLREEHQIIVTVSVDCTAEPKYVYDINVFKGNPRNLAEKEWGWYFHKQEDWGLYYTYEDALEEGLIEALKLI